MTTTDARTFAAIDIGSNAARLLIKRLTDTGELKKQLLVRVPLRLGLDVFSDGIVSKGKAKKLLRLMKAYKQLIKIYDVDRMRACATSAMRDAVNGEEILRHIREKTGIDINIIGGDEEARIVYDNHIERQDDPSLNYAYVDVGGGSTEVNIIHDGQLTMSHSYNIGTVRLLTGSVMPGERDRMTAELRDVAARYPGATIIGSGGNINKLYKMAREKDAATQSITVAELQRLYDMLAPLTVEQRMERYDLRADRADVIVPAAGIFLDIARSLGATRIVVPMIGIADGIIDSLATS